MVNVPSLKICSEIVNQWLAHKLSVRRQRFLNPLTGSPCRWPSMIIRLYHRVPPSSSMVPSANSVFDGDLTAQFCLMPQLWKLLRDGHQCPGCGVHDFVRLKFLIRMLSSDCWQISPYGINQTCCKVVGFILRNVWSRCWEKDGFDI